MNIILIVTFLGILYFLAHAFTAFFSRSKIPDVLWLMIIGLFLGPIFGIIDPSTLGAVGQVFVTVTLVIILFQGGIGISFNAFMHAWQHGIVLTLVNFFATVLVVGFASNLFLGLNVLSSFMLGAIIGGTSSAVVIPMLQQLKMRSESKAILILESALNDVLVIVVALAFLDFQTGNTHSVGFTLGSILASFSVAIILGGIGALLWSIILDKIRTLQNSIFATPAFVFIIFGAAELLGFSGYIAALTFGIIIGNMDILQGYSNRMPVLNSARPAALNETERQFFSEIVFLLKTFFFVYLGLSIKLTDSKLLYVGLILTAICFILRIPVIRFSVSRKTPKEDASLMAVMVPKGLAAAAMASLPLQRGLVGGETVQNVTFAIILFSTAITSILVWLVHKTPVGKLYHRLFLNFETPPGPEPSVITEHK